MANHTQGKFSPKYPKKYRGDTRNIIFRSSWELKLFRYCDLNESVLKWSSEEIVVPYVNPVTGSRHRYFIDVWLTFKSSTGEIQEKLIEVKPKKFLRAPPKQLRKTKSYIREVETWIINQAKWKAAEKFARKNKQQFLIFTERELGIK